MATNRAVSKKNEVMIDDFRINTFEPAPDGFDPLTASAHELTKHGIVPKPDKTKEAELYKKWFKVYSKKLHHIVPEFRKNEQKRHIPARDKKFQKDGTATSTNWSGAVVNPPAGDTFTWITGNWIIPDVNQPAGEPTGQWYYSSAWIGIDGDGSNDVLQAGTESDVISQNGALTKQIGIWWEWFPLPSVNITNLPVNAGDYMTCLICVTSPNTASIYLTNITTGVHASFQITAPAGTTVHGNCAEWILEAPTVNGNQSALADYGATFFDLGYATSKKSVQVNSGTGTAINMVNSSNAVISQTTLDGAEIEKVAFV